MKKKKICCRLKTFTDCCCMWQQVHDDSNCFKIILVLRTCPVFFLLLFLGDKGGKKGCVALNLESPQSLYFKVEDFDNLVLNSINDVMPFSLGRKKTKTLWCQWLSNSLDCFQSFKGQLVVKKNLELRKQAVKRLRPWPME